MSEFGNCEFCGEPFPQQDYSKRSEKQCPMCRANLWHEFDDESYCLECGYTVKPDGTITRGGYKCQECHIPMKGHDIKCKNGHECVLRYTEQVIQYNCYNCGKPLDYDKGVATGEGDSYEGYEIQTTCNCGKKSSIWRI